MKKRLLKSVSTVLVLALMCLSLCSCQAVEELISTAVSFFNPHGIIEDTSLGYTELTDYTFTYSAHYSPYTCHDSYDLLETDSMRQLYDMLKKNVYFVYPKAEPSGEYKTKQVVLEESCLSEAQIRLTVKALTDDNPHIFWLTTTFGYLVSEESNYTAVQLYSYISPVELIDSASKLKTQVNDFYKKLSSGMTDYQLEQHIHDTILNICEYDSSIPQDTRTVSSEQFAAFDTYGVLVDKKAVCEGYARTFQMLSNGVGIRCINIIGHSEGELHMWNAVKLDGDWYYVDTTWDDNSEKGFRYDYFNINEKQLLEDHKFSELCSELTDEQICGDDEINSSTANFFIPECTQTAYNYYVRNSAHLTDFNSDSIVKSLTKAAMNKEEYFNFYIDPDEFSFDYAVDQLFYSYPQYFFDYIDIVNASIPDYAIDENNLSLYEKKHLNVVLVELKYI